MGDVINLRRARKARIRSEAEQAASTARAYHGRSLPQRTAEQTEAVRFDRHVAHHRLEPPAWQSHDEDAEQ